MTDWKTVPTEPTPAEVNYVLRYGGRCRECADRDGVCETGLPCSVDDAAKVIRHIIGALNYGRSHGFLPASPPAPAGEPVAYAFLHDVPDIGPVWRTDREWNGKTATISRPLYAHPLDAEAIRAEADESADRQWCEGAKTAVSMLDPLVIGVDMWPQSAQAKYRKALEEIDRLIATRQSAIIESRRERRADADKGEAEGWRPTHQHVKRGTTYRVIGEAEAQVSTGRQVPQPDGPVHVRNVQDGDKLTVYQGEDGKLWARFTDEFNDGRFVAFPAPPAGGRDGE